MDDEHRGIRCDDLSRKGRCRDVDEIAADAQGTVPAERRGAGVWSATDDEDPSVLTLVAPRARAPGGREFSPPPPRRGSRRGARVWPRASSPALGGAPP